MEATHDGLIATDLEGRPRYYSQQCLRVLGLSEDVLHDASFEEAQRLTHVGSWEWSVEYDMIHWSEETYRIFGLDSEAELRVRRSRVVPQRVSESGFRYSIHNIQS